MTIDAQVTWEIDGEHRKILTKDALQFAARLHKEFDPARIECLKHRVEVQHGVDEGNLPGFLEETRHIRESDWRCAPPPSDITQRKVEITGPAGDRKMMINALNSGADVYMADLEDSQSPTWQGLMDGQVNLYDAVRRTITFTKHDGKRYMLGNQPAVLFVRPRGWHMIDKHITVDGDAISASILDFALHFYHNARELLDRGSRPYLYLPKMKHHEEAQLWNNIFLAAQDMLGMQEGTIKATFLVETLGATLQCDEMIAKLGSHCAGANFGRWDWIFDWMKTFREWPDKVLPDRSSLTMDKPFLQAASEYMVETCHRRGVHAIDGMSAQIPIKNDIDANAAAMATVTYDKVRGKMLGHDGAWVAHPNLVPLVHAIYADVNKNQFGHPIPKRTYAAEEFMQVPHGEITEQGIRTNITVPVEYQAAWLCGTGCVPLHNKMEDAATCEISREQLGSWVRHGIRTSYRHIVTSELVGSILAQELGFIKRRIGEDAFVKGEYPLAERLFLDMVTAKSPPDFLTTFCYDHLDKTG